MKNLYEELEKFTKLISIIFSPMAETLIHDLSKKEFPIMCIYNGHLSGRSVGDSTTMYGTDVDNFDPKYEDKVVLFEAPNGNRFKSCSKIFCDDAGKPRYAISINVDIQQFYEISERLQEFIHLPDASPILTPPTPSTENLNKFAVILEQTKRELAIGVGQVNRKDQKRLIQALDAKNALDMYGAIKYLMEWLNISRTTIFNYRKLDN